jgi:hypothetical protein
MAGAGEGCSVSITVPTAREGAIVGTARRVDDCGARAMDSCVYSYSWLDQPHDVKVAAARFASIKNSSVHT